MSAPHPADLRSVVMGACTPAAAYIPAHLRRTGDFARNRATIVLWAERRQPSPLPNGKTGRRESTTDGETRRTLNAQQRERRDPTTWPRRQARRWTITRRDRARLGEAAAAAPDDPTCQRRPRAFDPREITAIVSRDARIPTDTREIWQLSTQTASRNQAAYGDTRLMNGFATPARHEVGILCPTRACMMFPGSAR